MWLVFAFLYSFFLAVVNYIDEYLTENNALPASIDIHTRIGGLILVSTLFTGFGTIALWFVSGVSSLPTLPLILGLVSSIPLVLMWISYFYLLNTYPVYQVIPLFQIASIWLLIVEIIAGNSITSVGLAGIAVLIVGSYLLDSGTFKWQIPTKLLFIMLPVTIMNMLSIYLVRVASLHGPILAISFWQFLGVTILGVLMIILIIPYRNGLLYRVRHQGKNFLGLSIVNEGSSQAAYASSNVAISLAPLATYFSAMGGLHSVLLLFLFLLFPQKPITINRLQIGAIFLIAFGVFILEGWKYF